MNIKKSMLKIAALSVVAFSVLSCDQDFETLGGNIIGDPGFNADLYDEAQITATSVNLPPVQTNNLPVNLLGYYNHNIYGPQTANILTQLELSATSPDFGNLALIDSVVLKIPYFSTELEPDEDGGKVYELDSVIGSNPIKLSIRESNFFLNQFDPETNFEKAQKYYSNMHAQIQANLSPRVIYTNDNFIPSKREIVEFERDSEGENDTVVSGPALRIKLDNDYFQQKILNKAGAPELANAADFRNYLRGIYIEAEGQNDRGTMMLLNLAHSDAGITLYYTSEEVDTEDSNEDGSTSDLVPVHKSFKLKFGPGKVKTFQQEASQLDGENIFLKGGEGSMAVINLFDGPDSDGDGVSDELEFLRENNWLINEANLTFYVNRNFMTGSLEPEQLYLYDLNNNRILTDYVLERAGEANQLNSKANNLHLGILERDEDKGGIKYKIRLTNHINNLLSKDSTNVKLGLVVSQNVNLLTNSALLTSPAEDLKMVPVSSVIQPLGTVLHGPDSPEDDKRLKLNIYYTEAKE